MCCNDLTQIFCTRIVILVIAARLTCPNIAMAQCKSAVTPVRWHWSYCSLALSHRSHLIFALSPIFQPTVLSVQYPWHCGALERAATARTDLESGPTMSAGVRPRVPSLHCGNAFNYVTWAQLRRKSSATRLFIQHLVQVNNEVKIKAWHDWLFCENQIVTGGFPSQ